MWTATAHCITIVIGAGVLALAWSVAQLGWIAGPVALLAFAVITYYTSILLADCYRFPDPVNGTRNPTYMSAVRSYLGTSKIRSITYSVEAFFTNSANKGFLILLQVQRMWLRVV